MSPLNANKPSSAFLSHHSKPQLCHTLCLELPILSHFTLSIIFLQPSLHNNHKAMEAQEFFQNTFYPQFPSDNIAPSTANASATDHFLVEDFFDFSNNDDPPLTDTTFDSLPTDHSPTLTTLGTTTTNSNFPPTDAHFSGDLSVPVHTSLQTLYMCYLNKPNCCLCVTLHSLHHPKTLILINLILSFSQFSCHVQFVLITSCC